MTRQDVTILKYDYQLIGGKLKVKVTDVEMWDIIAIRSDDGKEDIFPLGYFQKHFKKIDKE
ncbi:hypothetical protein CIL05_07370 [Virgibacillus profundi]|uniref:Uncharacterized protein n=1 Tax=Virgibacillus profundi TaxID=2024555 RepID=A0A2A2IGK8_9BACI|nr:hypothetical protein [Virgibacillus profundi]PAV30280.1 hypothetical protein CIL05_07370 [Virgibacillus profundi]PXY54452.1 hypothetical protein CIT14_07455 [Virgibacillus profundi]